MDIRRKIQEYCIALANEDNALKYSRYFKEGIYNGYGLTSAQIKTGAKELLNVPGVTLKALLDVAPEIISNGKDEEISVMMLSVNGFHKQFSKDTFRSISTWYKYGISNWAHADTLGMLVLPVFLHKKLIVISDFENWLASENKFQRRTVPVTLIKILKSHENYKDLFTFIERLMSDPEREVHQGTGWFLREAWKKKPSETGEFLLKWKDRAPRLIIQYASEKMTAVEKAKYKKIKS